jgi:hypothetical protein
MQYAHGRISWNMWSIPGCLQLQQGQSCLKCQSEKLGKKSAYMQLQWRIKRHTARSRFCLQPPSVCTPRTSEDSSSSSSKASDVQCYTAVLFEPIRQQHYKDRLKVTRTSPGCHPNTSPCCANSLLTCTTGVSSQSCLQQTDAACLCCMCMTMWACRPLMSTSTVDCNEKSFALKGS